MNNKIIRMSMMVVLASVLLSLTNLTAAQAQDAPILPLAERGSYVVGERTIALVDESRDNREIVIELWYPAVVPEGSDADLSVLQRAHKGLRDAPPDRSGAPYPLIIYSHGWTGGNGRNVELSEVTEQLASHGYVVAAAQHHDTKPLRFELVDRPLDIMFVLNELAAISDGDLAGIIDTSNVGLMGWSVGGTAVLQLLGLGSSPAHYADWCAQNPDLKTWDCTRPADVGIWDFDSIGAYRAELGLQDLPDGSWAPFGDERIHAVLALGPCFYSPLTTEAMLAAVTTPTLIIHGTQDDFCDYEGNAVRAYTHLGTDDRYLITWVNGTHTAYFTLQDLPLHFARAFFGNYLKGDQIYASYLTSGQLPEFRGALLAWGPYESK